MAVEERDRTDEWLLPDAGGAPTVRELEERIDVALTVARGAEASAREAVAAAAAAEETARGAEAAVLEIGTAAVDAAVRAERAAAAGGVPAEVPEEWTASRPADPRLADFEDRADRLADRLRALASS